ncbi:hypothetical protein QAD02_023636 [Eretmocerus hayati]|uniref:Uncharacterized protein n=1 Tax=Eretmocerus hayati TaxID=131215 RepID=A0ACC2PY27_9HYME|nr:hypothetical protein QAD02_023636 [Eretmocerus hayati]
MSVPSYSDLGARARGVFKCGYAYDFARLRLAGPALRDLGVDGLASFDLKNSKYSGTLLGKYDTGYGKASLKAQTSGPLVAEYEIKEVVEHVDVTAGASINVPESFQTIKLAGKYHNEMVHTTTSLTKDFDRSVDLLGSAVLKLGNFLLGCQAGFDANSSQVTSHDLALGVELGDTSLVLKSVQLPSELDFSAYYKVNDAVDVAMDAKIASNDETKLWFLGIGAMCKVGESTKLRFKFDKNFQFGSSLVFNLHQCAKLVLNFNLDMSNPTSGQHKVGLAIDYEA